MGKPDAHVDKHSYSHTSPLYMHTMSTYITAAVQRDMSVNEVRKVQVSLLHRPFLCMWLHSKSQKC